MYFWTRASSVALNGSGASDDLSAAVSAMLRIPCSGPTDSAGGKDGVQAPDPGTSETTTGQGDGASRGDNSKPQVDIRPTALVLGYYQQSSLNKAQPGLLPDNVALCSLPDGELDFQEVRQKSP